MNLLTIDLGTSVIKVALFSAEGELLGWVAESHAPQFIGTTGAEQNPECWWHLITKAVHRLWDAVSIPPESVQGIACTSQWSGTVPVDRAGNPIRNAIIWLDSRGAPYIHELIGGFPSIEGYRIDKLWTWLHLTGGAPGKSGKDSLAHILYLKYAEPRLYAETFKFLEPKDYLNLRLTGHFASSYETVTLLWATDNRNLERVDYHPKLLRLTGLNREQLPDLYPSTTILGTVRPKVAEEWGIPRTAQVVIGTPDLHASAIGSGGIDDFQAYMTLSTSSWISCHVRFKKTDILHNIATLPSAVPRRYFIANEQESAGVCLTFLRDLMFDSGESSPNPYACMDALASEVPAGSEGLLFTPWLYGERTPVENHAIRGGFHRVSLNHRKGHFVRAVLEGVALNARWLLRYVERMAGRRLEPIRLIGGGARSDLWCQIVADVLQREVWQIEDPQSATVRGVALLGLVSLGWSDWKTLTRTTPVRQVYRPNPALAPLYEELFREFLARYRWESRWARHRVY